MTPRRHSLRAPRAPLSATSDTLHAPVRPIPQLLPIVDAAVSATPEAGGGQASSIRPGPLQPDRRAADRRVNAAEWTSSTNL
jgi:hypothetical protein